MPNWTECDLEVSGSAKDVAAFKRTAKTGKVDFSFEPFLPLPKELDIGPVGKKEEEGPAAEARHRETGYTSWYDRNIDVLGTKWDVKGELAGSKPGSVGYTFESAWAPPTNGVVALSKMYPKLDFFLAYDEPGMDFAGELTVKAGEVVRDLRTKSIINKECQED